jgi:hypothetical protein
VRVQGLQVQIVTQDCVGRNVSPRALEEGLPLAVQRAAARLAVLIVAAAVFTVPRRKSGWSCLQLLTLDEYAQCCGVLFAACGNGVPEEAA